MKLVFILTLLVWTSLLAGSITISLPYVYAQSSLAPGQTQDTPGQTPGTPPPGQSGNTPGQNKVSKEPIQTCGPDSVLNPSTGKCESEPTCTAGHSFDPESGECVGTVVTEEHGCHVSVFNPQTGQYEFHYDPQTGLCEGGTYYGVGCSTDQQIFGNIYYPEENICRGIVQHGQGPTCTSGTFNPQSGYCEETVTSEPVCATLLDGTRGTYIREGDYCEIITTQPAICITGGTLNKQTGLCEKTVTSQPICSGAILNTSTGMCETQPSLTCSPGYTLDQSRPDKPKCNKT